MHLDLRLTILLLATAFGAGCQGASDPSQSPPAGELMEPAAVIEAIPGPWSGRPVAFSFTSDDGDSAANLAWRDVFLEKGARYTLFIISGQVGWAKRLSAGEINTFFQDGFEIGSHSRTHVRLTDLDDAQLQSEVLGSRLDLEAIVGGPYRCRTLSYPLHAHDGRVMAAAESAGYVAARDGAASSQGHPDFSEGLSRWKNTALYEVPLTVSASWLTSGNTLTEQQTRARVQNLIYTSTPQNLWIVVYAHFLSDIDVDHMRWILEEMQSGGVWIETLDHVATYYRTGHQPAPIAPHPKAVKEPTPPRGGDKVYQQ